MKGVRWIRYKRDGACKDSEIHKTKGKRIKTRPKVREVTRHRWWIWRGRRRRDGGEGEREEQALALWNALKDREQLLARACSLVARCRGRGPFRRKPASLRAKEEKAKEEEAAVADRLASINYHIVVRPTLDASVW